MRLVLDSILLIAILVISYQVNSQVITDIGTNYYDLVYREVILLAVTIEALKEQKDLYRQELAACGCTREHQNKLIQDLTQIDLEIETMHTEASALKEQLAALHEEHNEITSTEPPSS